MKDLLVKVSLPLRIALCAVSLAIVFIPATVQAQPVDDNAFLTGPLPAPVSNYSQWVVTFSYPEDKPKSTTSVPGSNPPPVSLATRARTITTTKTGEIVHEEIVNGLGAKHDEWHVGAILYIKGSDSTVWGQIKSGNSNFASFPASGFRDLDWITKNSFVGTIKYSGRSCLVFIPGASHKIDLSNPDELDSLDTYAFLDAESRLPVKVQFGGSTRLYQFGDAPTQKLTLPPDLADQLEKGREAEERLNQRMPRPY